MSSLLWLGNTNVLLVDVTFSQSLNENLLCLSYTNVLLVDVTLSQSLNEDVLA